MLSCRPGHLERGSSLLQNGSGDLVVPVPLGGAVLGTWRWPSLTERSPGPLQAWLSGFAHTCPQAQSAFGSTLLSSGPGL